MITLTGKTIGQLTLLTGITNNTLFPCELSGLTFHIPYSGLSIGGGGTYEEMTYDEIYSLYTGGTLIPGGFYLMTDFQTCYDQPDFDSNKSPIVIGNYKTGTTEPLLLLSTSISAFSPTVFSILHPYDKIKYDITFNQTEVTGGPAKGRITERIDEFNNRTDYDHRQVLFKRYQYIELNISQPLNGTVIVTPLSSTEMSVTGNNTNFNSLSVGQYVGFQTGDFRVYEITSISGDTEMYISGLTTTNLNGLQMYFGNPQSNTLYYQNNVSTDYIEYFTFDYDDTNINNYIGDYVNISNYEENTFILANNVFKGFAFRNNTFGDGCYNNTFDDDCENNIIGNYFYNNSTDDDFDGNTIGNWFNNNRITSNFQYNRIGENFENNYLVQSDFYRNNIMNYFNNNIIDGNDFQNNEIGNQFGNNILLNGQFYKNDIGNGYNNNKVYTNFYGNLIGNGFNGNDIYTDFYDNVIGEYYESNNLGDVNNLNSVQFYLNKIGVSFNNNNISGQTYNNVIGNDFENNTIYNNFYDNQIFNQFKGNMILDGFYYNKIDWGFSGNEFSGTCAGNTFGAYIFSNDFLGDVYGNNIKDDFYSNVIDNGFTNNDIGSVFTGNSIGPNFQNNEIGSFFTDNTIGEGFGQGYGSSQKNYIGDNFQNNTIGEYFYNNRVGINFTFNTLGDYFQWNVINTSVGSNDFTVNYGNITAFTYTALGTTATDNTYIGLTGITNGIGINATFDVEVSGGSVIGVSGNTEGKLYMCGNTITILGTQIGGYFKAIDSISDDGVGKNGSNGLYNLSATGGTGTDANFDVSVSGGLVDSVTIGDRGNGYEIGDELTIIGSLFGGTDGVDNITITVTALFNDNVVITVSGVSTKPSVYEPFTCQIFERKGGDKRLSFYDENDILTITNINE